MTQTPVRPPIASQSPRERIPTQNPVFSPRLSELLDRSAVFVSQETILSTAYRTILERGYGFIEEMGEFPRIFTLRGMTGAIDRGCDLDRSTVGEIGESLGNYLLESDFEDIFSLALEIKRKKIKYFPVFNDKKELLGVITPKKLIQVLKSCPIARSTLVSEILTPHVVTATAHTPMREIARLLNAHRTDTVILVDGEGRPIGYCGEREAIEFPDRIAGDCQKAPYIGGKEEENLETILDRLESRENESLPIISTDGRLTGAIGYLEALQLLHPARLYHRLEIQQQQTRSIEQKVEYANDSPERVSLKTAIEQVSQGIAAYTGENFFCSLVRYLAEALEVDYVFLGELIGDDRLGIIAVYGNGRILPNFQCSLLNTPCQAVIGNQVQHYPDRVRECFPNADILCELRVEGYLGIPLWTAEHQPLGILGVFHRSPLYDIKLPIELLKIFAVRASAELERQSAIGALFQLNQELESRVARRTRELEVLLKEIHHRVKNNLNVMSHLLEWQASLLPDPDTRAIFQESQARIQTMALIHDQLYQTGSLAKVNLRNYIEQLVNNIFFTYGYGRERHRLLLDLQPIELSLDKAIPCGLIVNELLTNAFKYAFPDGRKGQIQIALFSAQNRSIHLKIHDDGVGISPDIDWRETNTLGLKLVNLLTRQIEGLIELDRTSGTTFHLIFNP